MDKYKVTLTAEERQQLEGMVSKGGCSQTDTRASSVVSG